MRGWIFCFVFSLIGLAGSVAAQEAIFYESFDNLSVIELNGGDTGNISLVTGIKKRGISMQSSNDNLLVNPDFEETDNVKWIENGGGTDDLIISMDSIEKYEGDQSVKISKTGSQDWWYGQTHLPYVEGDTYTFSVYAKGSVGGETLKLRIYDRISEQGCDMTLTNNWEKYTCTKTISSDATTLYAFLRFGSGSSMWIDSAELNKSSSPFLTYPISEEFNPNQGTIEMWVKPYWEGNERVKYRYFFSTNDGEFQFAKWWDRSGIEIKIFDWEVGGISTSTWESNEWHHIAFTWEDGIARHYMDGNLVSTDNTYTPVSFTSTSFFIGHNFGVNQANAVIDELIIYNYSKTEGFNLNPRCGNSICNLGEDLYNCPIDCNEYSLAPPDEIDVVSTGEYTIGTYVYPGWQARSYKSLDEVWDPVINAVSYVEGSDHPKEPLMNYYDDSNPIAVDWMIKWNLEHGVSLFVYDWYWRQDGEILHQEPLEDAFLQSKYLSLYPDKINFTIMWANHYSHNYPTLEEDLENMMDYIIQNYFQYPQYFKIDNKPVFMIWDHDRIVDVLEVDGTRDLFNEWRQMSIDAGYDGLFIVVLDFWDVPYSELSELGIDGPSIPSSLNSE